LLGLFGATFRVGYFALLLLAAAESVQGAFGVADLIFAYRRPRLGLGIALTGAATTAAVAALLIGQAGIAGAAAAMLIGALVRAAVRRIVLRRLMDVAPPLAPTLLPIAFGAVGLALAIALRGTAWLGLAAGLGSFALLLFAWRRATGTRLVPHGFADELP
jgi:hypothetical protein